MKNIWIMPADGMQRMCFHRLLGQWRRTDASRCSDRNPAGNLHRRWGSHVNGKDFVTAAKLILKNSADATKTLDIEGAAFTATSVTFTVPADAEAGN